jgi:ketosteroid isomerase-like protein
MNNVMKTVCLTFLALVSAGAYAQSDAETAALDVIGKYWEARNNQDFSTQVALTSEDGTLDANSDGSFFRTSPRVSAEELEKLMVGTQSTRVFYPEATELADGDVMVRYYLEGYVESPEGSVPNYRTRVTTALVEESGGWKIRAWHFSPLHDGGRHLTAKTDFED